jgi:hypothetical protein
LIRQNGPTFCGKEKRENEVPSKHLLGASENSATAVSQLVQTEPGFPVELGGAIELHAAFREESGTSFPSESAACRKSGGATSPFVVFSQRRPLFATFTGPQ